MASLLAIIGGEGMYDGTIRLALDLHHGHAVLLARGRQCGPAAGLADVGGRPRTPRAVGHAPGDIGGRTTASGAAPRRAGGVQAHASRPIPRPAGDGPRSSATAGGRADIDATDRASAGADGLADAEGQLAAAPPRGPDGD